MADTVKKSRIVCDQDNLEESLMEEFNQRLKSCMVQDIEIQGMNSEDFIEVERSFNLSNGCNNSNGYTQESSEPKLANMAEEQLKAKPDILENLYETVGDENIYENVEIDNTEKPTTTKPNLTLPTTCLTTSESLDLDADHKSVKDRMFLSTDDASCLLFTQTVTSPMLTPSEENIDFLKGFRRQSSQNTTSSSPPSNEEKNDSDKNDVETTENVIYENLGPDAHVNIYENVESVKSGEHVNLKTESQSFIDQEAVYSNLTEVVKEALAPKASHSEIESFDDEDSQKIEEAHIPNDKEDKLVFEDNSQEIREETTNTERNQVIEEIDQKLVEETTTTEINEERKEAYEETIELTMKSNEDSNHITTEINKGEIETIQFNEAKDDMKIVENMKIDEDTKMVEDDLKIVENLKQVIKETNDFIQNENVCLIDNQIKQEDEEQCLEKDVNICDERKAVEFQHTIQKDNEEMCNRTDEQKSKRDESFEDILKNGELKKPYSFEIKEKTKKFEEIAHKTDELPVITTNKMVISPSENIQNLKSVFMKSETESTITNTEKLEFTELKTLDIMKQIHKFENIGPKDSNDDFKSSSEMTTETTTTYVETCEIKNGTDKAIKKKKTKKSRSHEKENISVSDPIKDEERHYNVNVKNLCRSFGDLSKIGSETYYNEKNSNLKTKSMDDIRPLESLRNIENVFNGVSVKALKSSFNKFDALQKKNILHVRSSDSSKAQEKYNGSQNETNCKACDKQVFQMEQIKAEKAIWHKNCFRCTECSKQLTVDTYESHEGHLYCKPHFKSLFAPKVIEDDTQPKPRKHQLIICENEPEELPPDVARASDKPDLGLEELHNLNVKERFQVFENYEEQSNQLEKSPINVKKAPSILSKLARFQKKGMDIGVTDDSLNGIPIEASESEEEEEYEEEEGEDAELVRARRAQKEKPFHFTGMSDVKNKWEQGENQQAKDERREERKQEIQSIRNRLFMGKQGKMKEMYQQAVAEAESGANVRRSTTIEVSDSAKNIKEMFEKGEAFDEHKTTQEVEDMSVFESGISKKSRSIFLELDANASKPPQISPVATPKVSTEVKKMREVFANRQTSEDVVKSSELVDDVVIETADIQQRFKFFETYQEPQKQRRQFRITPPREGQIKAPTPDREIYRDPDVVRAEEFIEDSNVAKERHTATKMLNKFRQMEENLQKEQLPQGLKPLKSFTPPPEPSKPESDSDEEYSGSEEEVDEIDHQKYTDTELLEAQKAARAKQLRAKFEKWEANEIKKEQNNSSVNIHEEIGEEQSIESTKTLRARFESMRDTNKTPREPRVKVNRFVDTSKNLEICDSCKQRVYPLEKITVHNIIFHKNCFKCKECNAILRMNSYSYNQGLLYCTPHFKQLFISKGNYDTAFGLEQHKEKWNATVA